MKRQDTWRAVSSKRGVERMMDTGYLLPNDYGLTIVVCGKTGEGYSLIEDETGLAVGFCDRLREAAAELDKVVARHGLPQILALINLQAKKLNEI